MKIVKASVDLATWTLPTKCTTCASEIEIESKDLNYRYSTDGDHYFCYCILCKGCIVFNEKLIPKIVQRDVTDNRAVKTYSSWND